MVVIITAILMSLLVLGWGLYGQIQLSKATKDPASANMLQLQFIPTSISLMGLLAMLLFIAILALSNNLNPAPSSSITGSVISALALLMPILALTLSIVSKGRVNAFLSINPKSAEVLAMDTLNNALLEQNKLLTEHNKHTTEKLDEFMKTMVKKKTDVVVEALELTVQKFQKTFDDKISGMVGKNFESLNQSIDQLLVWQKEYKSHIDKFFQGADSISNSAQKLLDSVKEIAETSAQQLSKMADESKAITEQVSSLTEHTSKVKDLVTAIEKVTVGNNEFADLVKNMTGSAQLMETMSRRAITNSQQLGEISTGLEGATKNIKETSETINQIGGWQKDFMAGVMSVTNNFDKSAMNIEKMLGRLSELTAVSEKLVGKNGELTSVQQKLSSVMGDHGLFEKWINRLEKTTASFQNTQQQVALWAKSATLLTQNITNLEGNLQKLETIKNADILAFNDATRNMLINTFARLDQLFSSWITLTQKEKLLVDVKVL